MKTRLNYARGRSINVSMNRFDVRTCSTLHLCMNKPGETNYMAEVCVWQTLFTVHHSLTKLYISFARARQAIQNEKEKQQKKITQYSQLSSARLIV